MKKSIYEINEKILRKKAIVLTAEEMVCYVKEHGVKKAARDIDVVTTGTFGPMCSSGIYFNIPKTRPKIKLGGGEVTLNKVPAYAAYAARDVFLGASALPHYEKNRPKPINFKYGGAGVIEDLVRGRSVLLEATTYGTDCYPATSLRKSFKLADFTDAVLFNPRNCYQNYNVAVNKSGKTIYTYMGILKPDMGNVSYSSAGTLSPLLNDPELKTIGIGTRVFIAGCDGYIVWHGTQHTTAVKKKNGFPVGGAATVALICDLKKTSSEFLRAAYITGYGVSLAVGVGIPIPVLDESIARAAGKDDDEIFAPVIDYSADYPYGKEKAIGLVSYRELRSGSIKLGRKVIPSFSWSSLSKAVEISKILKKKISAGRFLLGDPVAPLPGAASRHGALSAASVCGVGRIK
ncbi:homocysteine biosynthesis protein [bacterium]|nr:hypothetical protein [bacterium]MBU3956489.1 homocysteine biosynthesis protein [bacterium]